MNKSELIKEVSESAKLTKKDASRAVDAIIQSITDSLKKGDTVSIVGFGTFTIKQRSARLGRNPITGKTISIQATKAPSFKAGKWLKEILSSGTTGGGGPGIDKE